MRTPEGRWVMVPVFIAIAVLVGMALVVGFLPFGSRLPAWVSTTPAAIALVVYYGLQLRDLMAGRGWRVNVGTRGDGVERQSNSGRAVAPVIKGDHNQITVIHADQRRRGRRDDLDD